MIPRGVPSVLGELKARLELVLRIRLYVRLVAEWHRLSCWLVRAFGDQAMDVINLKISKVGGLTKARQIRDLCVSLGIAMTIEDTWGGDIVTAAIAHLAHSTPPDLLFSSTDFNSYVTVSIAEGAPQRKHGRLAASTEAGLGIKPRFEVLGKPVFVIQ